MGHAIKISCAVAYVSMVVGIDAAQGAGKAITFDNACATGKRITVAAIGDLIFHKKLLARAFRGQSGFRQFWSPVARILKHADLVYGNLEGPAAHGVAAGGRKVKDPGMRLDFRVYGYRLPNLSFNYHPSVIADMKASGFDIISTANNHALDRGALGIDRTIENFEKAALPFSGTRKRDDQDRTWSTITETKGTKIAWLACTYSTNGIPDRHKQVLLCYKNQDQVLAEIKRLSDTPGIAAVFLTPHWGRENKHKPGARQRNLARKAIDAGATAVLGAHPHVVQPWEKYTTENGRAGLIAYSMGNFISNQRRQPQRVGMIALLELRLDDTGKAQIAAAAYVPTWVVIDSRGFRVIEAGAKSYAARLTNRLLPAGNRVRAAALPQLPKSCEPSGTDVALSVWPVAIPSVAPVELAKKSGSDGAKTAKRQRSSKPRRRKKSKAAETQSFSLPRD